MTQSAFSRLHLPCRHVCEVCEACPPATAAAGPEALRRHQFQQCTHQPQHQLRQHQPQVYAANPMGFDLQKTVVQSILHVDTGA